MMKLATAAIETRPEVSLAFDEAVRMQSGRFR